MNPTPPPVKQASGEDVLLPAVLRKRMGMGMGRNDQGLPAMWETLEELNMLANVDFTIGSVANGLDHRISPRKTHDSS